VALQPFAGGAAETSDVGEFPTPAASAADEFAVAAKKLQYKILQYPDDVGSAGQGHYIILKIHRKVQGKVKKVQAVSAAKTRGKSFTARTLALKGSHLATKVQISLYMPPSVEVSYKSDYADTEISALAGAGAGVIEAALKGKGAGGKMIDIGKSLGRGAAEVGTAAAILTMDTAAPGASAIGQIAAGKIQSSKMELLFKGVGRRSFNYTFAFIPKSAKESKSVDEIIYELKKAMLPEYTNGAFGALTKALGVKAGGTSDRTLTIPTTFGIEYYFTDGGGKRNNFLNKISTCYLTDLQVKYGGDRYKAYSASNTSRGESGAPPQRTEISLTFNEIEIITAEDIEKGF
jgi:hypothetical protein